MPFRVIYITIVIANDSFNTKQLEFSTIFLVIYMQWYLGEKLF